MRRDKSARHSENLQTSGRLEREGEGTWGEQERAHRLGGERETQKSWIRSPYKAKVHRERGVRNKNGNRELYIHPEV